MDYFSSKSSFILNFPMFLIGGASFLMLRSSHPEVFLGKEVLKLCSKFTVEHPCQSEISITLLCNFIEIALRHGCFSVNLLYIFRTLFPKNTSGQLLDVFRGSATELMYLNSFECQGDFGGYPLSFRGFSQSLVDTISIISIVPVSIKVYSPNSYAFICK